MSGIYTNWDSIAFRNYLKQFELPAKKKIKDFSKGMKVKLAFAVALSHKAELLILDEATSGLDPITWEDVIIDEESIATNNAKVIINKELSRVNA